MLVRRSNHRFPAHGECFAGLRASTVAPGDVPHPFHATPQSSQKASARSAKASRRCAKVARSGSSPHASSSRKLLSAASTFTGLEQAQAFKKRLKRVRFRGPNLLGHSKKALWLPDSPRFPPLLVVKHRSRMHSHCQTRTEQPQQRLVLLGPVLNAFHIAKPCPAVGQLSSEPTGWF